MILLYLFLWQLWEHFTGLLSNPQGNHCSHRHNKKCVVLTLVLLSPSFNSLALVAVSGHKEPKKGKKSIVLKLFAFQGYIHLGKGSTSFQKYSLLWGLEVLLPPWDEEKLQWLASWSNFDMHREEAQTCISTPSLYLRICSKNITIILFYLCLTPLPSILLIMW